MAQLTKLFRSALFTAGANAPDSLPKPSVPEIALWGRSNVGKSSILNALCQHKGLARVSHTPGRTQQLNFFLLDKKFYLVDLPGYGFAKASGDKKFNWLSLTRFYVETRRTLRMIIILIDARRGLTPLDCDVMAALDELGAPYLLVLTKADELKAAERAEALEQVQSALDDYKAVQRVTLLTSSKTGDGLEALRRLIVGFVA